MPEEDDGLDHLNPLRHELNLHQKGQTEYTLSGKEARELYIKQKSQRLYQPISKAELLGTLTITVIE